MFGFHDLVFMKGNCNSLHHAVCLLLSLITLPYFGFYYLVVTLQSRGVREFYWLPEELIGFSLKTVTFVMRTVFHLTQPSRNSLRENFTYFSAYGFVSREILLSKLDSRMCVSLTFYHQSLVFVVR